MRGQKGEEIKSHSVRKYSDCSDWAREVVEKNT